MLQRALTACGLPGLVSRRYIANATPCLALRTIFAGRVRLLADYLDSDDVAPHPSAALHALSVALNELADVCIGRQPYIQWGPNAHFASRRDDDDDDLEMERRTRKAQQPSSIVMSLRLPARTSLTSPLAR